MIIHKPAPMTRQNYWRFTGVFIVGIAVIYGVAIALDLISGERRTTIPPWHWLLGNVVALALTEISMALGGWVTVTDGIARKNWKALIFVVGYAIALGLLSQQELVSSVSASVGRLAIWFPWIWYLGWLSSMKSKGKRDEEAPTGQYVE